MSGSGPVRPIRIGMMAAKTHAQMMPQPAGRCGAARGTSSRGTCAPPAATGAILLYGTPTPASVSPRTNFLFFFSFYPFPAKPAIFFWPYRLPLSTSPTFMQIGLHPTKMKAIPSRVRCAYLQGLTMVRTAYPTWILVKIPGIPAGPCQFPSQVCDMLLGGSFQSIAPVSARRASSQAEWSSASKEICKCSCTCR